MKRTKWFERKFSPIEDNGLLPSIIERLAGTPARAEEMTRSLDMDQLQFKSGNRWSIKEEIGHLSDLEPLWLERMGDLVNNAPELKAADLTNQKTHRANHNETYIKTLLQQFREHREKFVNQLVFLNDEQLLHSSLHPRLKTSMRIIDLAYFVAEHDDHHLSAVREMMSMQQLLH